MIGTACCFYLLAVIVGFSAPSARCVIAVGKLFILAERADIYVGLEDSRWANTRLYAFIPPFGLGSRLRGWVDAAV